MKRLYKIVKREEKSLNAQAKKLNTMLCILPLKQRNYNLQAENT